MTDNEIIEALKTLLKPMENHMKEIDLKLDKLDLKIESLHLENKTEHRLIRKDIEHLNDEMETVIAALRAKDILPLPKQM